MTFAFNLLQLFVVVQSLIFEAALNRLHLSKEKAFLSKNCATDLNRNKQKLEFNDFFY